MYVGNQAKVTSLRETIACELLFREALNRCDNMAVRNFATQMLGATVQKTTTDKRTRLVTPAAEKQKPATTTTQRQATLTGFLRPQTATSTDNYEARKMIVESIQKQKKEKKEKAKAEKKPAAKRGPKAVPVPTFALEA